MDAEGYKHEAGFQLVSREPLVDLTLTDSTELWLIQWPQNELPDFQGTELPLSLSSDGCLGSFEGLSGKAYDVVSCAAEEPNATVFYPLHQRQNSLGIYQDEYLLSTTPIQQNLRDKKLKRNRNGSIKYLQVLQ